MWTAIAALQRTDADVVSVVYSGDIDASKEQIIAKVKVNRNPCQALIAYSSNIYVLSGQI